MFGAPLNRRSTTLYVFINSAFTHISSQLSTLLLHVLYNAHTITEGVYKWLSTPVMHIIHTEYALIIWCNLFLYYRHKSICLIYMKSKDRILRHISIASWNMQGTGNSIMKKIDDPQFISEITKHHIIGLVETHTCHGNYIKINGYHTFQVNRPKSGNACHGGIAILCKEELRQGLKFFNSPTPDILWVKLDKEYFGLMNDIYIGAVYISLVNSPYTKKLSYNQYEMLENEIAKYSHPQNETTKDNRKDIHGFICNQWR